MPPKVHEALELLPPLQPWAGARPHLDGQAHLAEVNEGQPAPGAPSEELHGAVLDVQQVLRGAAQLGE
eukprot:10658152-Alexandrium_andersonii.AAC.1